MLLCMSSHVQDLLRRQDTPSSVSLKNNVFISYKHAFSAGCYSLPRAPPVATHFFLLCPTEVKTIHKIQQCSCVAMDPDRFHSKCTQKVVPLWSTPENVVVSLILTYGTWSLFQLRVLWTRYTAIFLPLFITEVYTDYVERSRRHLSLNEPFSTILKKIRGLSPQANDADRATAACRRS
jgi:hypothetical protein